MPLEKSGSNAARSRNIAEMIRAGHPRDESVAAGYSNQRKYHGSSRGRKNTRK